MLLIASSSFRTINALHARCCTEKRSPPCASWRSPVPCAWNFGTFHWSVTVAPRALPRWPRARSSRAAGWKMHDALFRTATRWTSQAPSAPWFQHLADSLGLDGPVLELCVRSADVAGLLAADLALGRATGLIGVPALFLDGHLVTVRSQRGLVRRVKWLTRAVAP